MSQTTLEPIEGSLGSRSGRWMTTIFNNDSTPYGDVIRILMEATNCDREEAHIETWEAHHYGKAAVHFANRDRCEEVARIIESIGVLTSVTLEWEDQG